MLAIKLITAKTRKTNNRFFPISKDIPATPFAPKRMATSPRIKKPMATLNIKFLLAKSLGKVSTLFMPKRYQNKIQSLDHLVGKFRGIFPQSYRISLFSVDCV